LSGIPPAPRGVPKIDVTFDLDANGILNVSAKEVSTGKSKNITIKNDKGRLSKRDIEKMLADAERYKEEDDKQRERVGSKNALESYVFNVKQAVEEAGNKLSSDDKKKAIKECEACIKWLDRNQTAEKEEFEYKMKDLSKICGPIMTKLHRGGGGAGGGSEGPTIEEVD
jgi:heat shock protein 1/8